jgi:hypothetical protein
VHKAKLKRFNRLAPADELSSPALVQEELLLHRGQIAEEELNNIIKAKKELKISGFHQI